MKNILRKLVIVSDSEKNSEIQSFSERDFFRNFLNKLDFYRLTKVYFVNNKLFVLFTYNSLYIKFLAILSVRH